MKFVMFQSWYKEKDIQQPKNDEKIKSNFGAIAKKLSKKNGEVQPNFDKKKPVKSVLKQRNPKKKYSNSYEKTRNSTYGFWFRAAIVQRNNENHK